MAYLVHDTSHRDSEEKLFSDAKCVVKKKKYIPKRVVIKQRNPHTNLVEEKEYFDDSDFWLNTYDYI